MSVGRERELGQLAALAGSTGGSVQITGGSALLRSLSPGLSAVGVEAE